MLGKLKITAKRQLGRLFPPKRPTDYNQYLELQVNKYLSHELHSRTWSDGQRRYIRLEFVDINKTSRILDISCGDGVGLKYFKELGYTNLVGVEYSAEKAVLAQNYGFPVHTGDFHNISFLQSGSFDVVYSSHSLEHALFPVQVMAEFYRVLKVGGFLKLVLPYPDKGPLDAHVAKEELGTDQEDKGDKVLKFVQKQGFKIVNYKFDNYREDEIWITAAK